MRLDKISKTNFSFKDPSARVIKEAGIFKRYIHDSYELEFKHLLNSGLYEELCANHLMVRHTTMKNIKLPSTFFVVFVLFFNISIVGYHHLLEAKLP